ncbi:hypothetical protein PPROV_000385600 [Pycnococcus provasolii]|uniref:Uncharacterized protein n=1 Tax=Pycnococcus provasolii TaxID=41880 RepID=A0A830HDG2_9CHLO|nr:hypothetical protein PPROV_000385600 [Pycnococcus provasolii]
MPSSVVDYSKWDALGDSSDSDDDDFSASPKTHPHPSSSSHSSSSEKALGLGGGYDGESDPNNKKSLIVGKQAVLAAASAALDDAKGFAALDARNVSSAADGAAEDAAEAARRAEKFAKAAGEKLNALSLGNLDADVDTAIEEARRGGNARRNEEDDDDAGLPSWLSSACDAAALDAERVRGRIEEEERERAKDTPVPPATKTADPKTETRPSNVVPPAKGTPVPPATKTADPKTETRPSNVVPPGVRLVRTSDGPDPLMALLR